MDELQRAGLSPLIGRGDELGALRAALTHDRLVTVTGPGGVGKTRLALAAIDDFSIGVRVALGAVSDPAAVLSTVMQVAGIRPETGVEPIDTLTASLAGTETTILLDNCEHVREAAAELCAELLRRLPAVRLLATSRVPLGVPGEQSFELVPLTSDDAVSLFLDRARRANRTFAAQGEDLARIDGLCRELDGLPLAIELAAARTRMLDVRLLAADLSRRLDLVAGGDRDAPRHRSLRASMEWSCELLSEPERALFERLSVFAGGCSLEAAEAVCPAPPVDRDAVLDMLGALVDQSLLVAGDGRFTMLSTVHAYARERNAHDDADTHQRHAAWCADFAETQERRLTGGEQAQALAALDRETDNIRASLAWSREHDPELALRIASACALHWHARGRLAEGRETLAALNPPARATSPGLRARALWAHGLMLVTAGDLTRARPIVEEAVGRARDTGDPGLQARALNLAGELALMTDPATADGPLRTAADLAREAGDGWCLADALGKLGAEALYRSDGPAAEPLFAECLEIAQAAGDERAIHRALGGLARVAAIGGDGEAAVGLLGESLAISRRLGDRSWLALDLAMLGELERFAGRPRDGRTTALEALALAEEIDAGYARCLATGILGRIALALGEQDEAGRRFAAAIELGERAGVVPFASWWQLGLADVELGRGDLDGASRAARSALTRAEEIGNARDVARAIGVLGAVALERGESDLAIRQLTSSLAAERNHYDRPGARRTLDDLLRALDAAGQDELHERLAAALERGPDGFDDAVALALRGRGPRRRDRADGWGGLTRAEAEVAELAASGLSNPQIAEQLFMSRATVKRHLSRVFAQFAVGNRTELARAVQATRGGE